MGQVIEIMRVTERKSLMNREKIQRAEEKEEGTKKGVRKKKKKPPWVWTLLGSPGSMQT